MASTLSPYTLLEEIGETADAIIHRGLQGSDGAPVWIKIPKGGASSPRDIARVKLEYATTRDLDVPGVVRALGLHRAGDGLALVLEDFGGRSLRALLRERRVDLTTALWIAASIAGTLAAIHERGVVHKRLTPDSIIVDLDARKVALSDFSAATRLSREAPARALSLDMLPGILPYMSPEQTGRVDRPVDRRADLYSLGVTLYEALTGALPFPSNDPVEIVHSTIARIPPAPHEIASDIPAVVSAIVVKLLAKAAEDRYEHADDLAADLTACLSALADSSEIRPFPLGRRSCVELRVPQKLYGREAERAALLHAFGRARAGASALVLVEGGAGMGKSALIGELREAVIRARGMFIAGKSEQAGRGAPYAPIVRAFRGLLQEILMEGEASLALLRRDLSAALGQRGQVLVDLLPELSLIVGPQPSAPDLGAVEAENRFSLVFQDFLRVFATFARPLVLFLDDLQWADPASLMLLERLLLDPGSAHLLVICAYRGYERGPGEFLRRSLAAVSTLSLGPLSQGDVDRLLADALSCDDEVPKPLGELLFAKTGGVPLALHQRLEALRDDARLLTVTRPSGAVTWDLARVGEAIGAHDAAALTAARIDRLAPATLRVLSLAACIGRSFDHRTLSSLHERPPSETAADLWAALAEGLVLPLDADYQLVQVGEGTFSVAYEFAHDRVQQAAYARISAPERCAMHRRIGALLRDDRAPAGDEELFSIVRHQLLGAPLISDRGERAEVARLALRAGRRAKQTGAYQAAAGYFEAGASLLDEASWDEDQPLAFALLVQRAECEHRAGDVDRAEALFELASTRAVSDLHRAEVARVRVVLYTMQGRVADAMRVGQAALSLLGIDLPATEDARGQTMDAELAEITANLGPRPIASLIEAKEIVDPVHKAILELLQDLQVPAQMTSMALRNVVILKHVNLSLRHGHAAVSAYGYMAYGAILARSFSRYQEAYAFGRLALDLNARLENADLTCKLHHFFGSFLHFLRPLREALSHFHQAVKAGLESGDFQYLSFAACNAVAIGIGLGDDLRGCGEQIERFAGILARTGDATSRVFLSIGRQVIKSLTGGVGEGDESEHEREIEAALERPGFMVVATFHHVMKLLLRFHHGDHEGALAAARMAERIGKISEGMYFATELSFYACLALAAQDPPLPDPAMLADHRSRLERWSEGCPENFEHKSLLVDAEIARVHGDDLAAMALYDRAIAAARRSDLARDEALASELSARFHLTRGRLIIARAYMTEAYLGYLRWGATAKAEELARAHPDLLEGPATRSGSAPSADRSDPLDVATILRAAQVIVENIVLEEVLRRSMWIVLETAGAERGLLLLDRDGRLVVEAAIGTDPDAVEVGSMGPAEDRADLALSIVQHVARTKEPVVLGDAAREGRFAADPSIVARRPRSLLCLPLVNQGSLAGILYLENNVTRDAFSPDRLALLRVLASLSAIAVKNALLYARVQAITGELQQTNQGLSIAVARRTEELTEANARLAAELVERARGERERAALTEEIIAAQRARLVELSAPLMPLSDRIMVMPLLGKMDVERAQQVLEAAITGAHANRTRFMILDITGLTGIDASVASTLLRTADALRLIGTRLVITGTRPEAARAFVDLGIDLGALVTRATLESGIAYATDALVRGRQ